MSTFAQAQWVDALRAGKGIYHLAELSRMSGLSIASVRRAVQRLLARGWLVRLGKCLYGNRLSATDLPTLERAALRLYPPMYVSLDSALFLHGVLDQNSRVLTCVTTNKTKTFETDLGTIEYHRIAPARFSGYAPLAGVPLASPEKAALDFLYLSLKAGRSPSTDEWNWEHLRPARLVAQSRAFPAPVRAVVQAALRPPGLHA